MGVVFRSDPIDQNRSSVNWPLAKVLQWHGDAETGFKGLRVYTCRVLGLGFRVQGIGFGVQGSGCRVQGSGCRIQGSGVEAKRLGFIPWGVGFIPWGVGFIPWGVGFIPWGVGFIPWGVGFRTKGLRRCWTCSSSSAHTTQRPADPRTNPKPKNPKP
jgi:hypothetical protein